MFCDIALMGKLARMLNVSRTSFAISSAEETSSAENRTPVHTIFSLRLYKLISRSGSRPSRSAN